MKGLLSGNQIYSSNELIESLKEYRSTINKIKSQQSLKNYHKKFKEHLQSKLIKSNEKQCEKVSNSIAPSLYSMHHFDILPIIFTQQSLKLEVLMPTTLYRDSNSEFLVKSENSLVFFTGPQIFEMFLNDMPEYNSMPACIFKPAGGKIKLFSSKNNVRLFLKSQKNFQGHLQYFIPPVSLNSSVLVVNYRKGCTTKSCILQNSFEIPLKEKFQAALKPSNPEDSLAADKILHSMLTEFSQKQKEALLKRKITYDFTSSVNNSVVINEPLPVLPDIKTKNFTNLIQRIKSVEGHEDFANTESFQLFLDNHTNQFLVDLANTRLLIPYNLKVIIPSVDYMTRKLFAAIELYLKRHLGKDVQEVNLSFVKDSFKNWVFLKVNALKYAQPYNLEECSNAADSMDETSFHMSFMENSRVLNTTFIPMIQSASKQLIDIKPVIKIKNIRDIKAKNYMNSLKKKKPNSSVCLDGKRYIDDAVDNLDMMQRNIKQRKKTFVDLSAKYSALGFWKEMIVRFYKSLLRSDCGRHFKRVGKEKIHGMSQAMFRVFCSDIGPNFIRDIVTIHKGITITNEDFKEFKEQFLDHLQSYINDKDDLETVEMNFDSLKTSLVNPSLLTFI